jgi:hypothetical protein
MESNAYIEDDSPTYTRHTHDWSLLFEICDQRKGKNFKNIKTQNVVKISTILRHSDLSGYGATHPRSENLFM